jgi:outer membrane protein
MTIHWGTAKSSILVRSLKQLNLLVAAKRPPSHSARSLLAALLAFLLAIGTVSPAYAQSPAQNPPSNPAPAVSTSTIAPVSSLGLAKHDFTRGPRAFPTLLDPYRPISIESPELTNSARIDQLIHDGKLSLSLQDAIELALENNLDIAIQRYYPWVADASILRERIFRLLPQT